MASYPSWKRRNLVNFRRSANIFIPACAGERGAYCRGIIVCAAPLLTPHNWNIILCRHFKTCLIRLNAVLCSVRARRSYCLRCFNVFTVPAVSMSFMSLLPISPVLFTVVNVFTVFAVFLTLRIWPRITLKPFGLESRNLVGIWVPMAPMVDFSERFESLVHFEKSGIYCTIGFMHIWLYVQCISWRRHGNDTLT